MSLVSLRDNLMANSTAHLQTLKIHATIINIHEKRFDTGVGIKRGYGWRMRIADEKIRMRKCGWRIKRG